MSNIVKKKSDFKTFNDLSFEQHPNAVSIFGSFKSQARVDFNNGYGVSVVNGAGAYSDDMKPYEVAVFKDGDICYDTPITNDVIGYCDNDDVTEIMIKVQQLKMLSK